MGWNLLHRTVGAYPMSWSQAAAIRQVGRPVTRWMPVRWPGGRRQGCVATVRAAIPGAGFRPGGPIAAPVDRCCSRRSLRRNTFEPSVPTGAGPWRAVTIASMSVCWVMSPVTVTISASGRESRKEVSRSPGDVDRDDPRTRSAARASPPSHRTGRATRGPGHRPRDDPTNSRSNCFRSVRSIPMVPTPLRRFRVDMADPGRADCWSVRAKFSSSFTTGHRNIGGAPAGGPDLTSIRVDIRPIPDGPCGGRARWVWLIVSGPDWGVRS